MAECKYEYLTTQRAFPSAVVVEVFSISIVFSITTTVVTETVETQVRTY
jgi:hypothetical protein